MSRCRKNRREKAARSTCLFLRDQAEMCNPSTAEELAALIWRSYWFFYKIGALAAPRATRAMLRKKYGYWKGAKEALGGF